MSSQLHIKNPVLKGPATHWGQGVVYPAGTLQIHHKEMDKVPTKNPPGTLQIHSEFSKPISLVFPVQEMPSTFTVFQVM